jgi:hypothetical protein
MYHSETKRWRCVLTSGNLNVHAARAEKRFFCPCLFILFFILDKQAAQELYNHYLKQ